MEQPALRRAALPPFAGRQKEEGAYMKLTGIRLAEVNVPLVTPFKTALRTVNSVNDIVIAVETDTGAEGYGEAPPTAVITGDTKGSIRCAIEDFIAPAICGMELCDEASIDAIMKKMQQAIVKNTSAKAAVDMAIYDLYGKLTGKPLYRLLGGSHCRETVETDLTISVNPVEEMVRDAQRAVAEGFRILKVKVGKEGLKDVERMEAIRKAVGPEIKLRVDANQGWSREEAVRVIRAMEDRALDIDLVEQPVKAHDFEGMVMVTQAVDTKILADESVFSPEDAERLIEAGGADLINIKLMKTGGIHEALRICRLAEQHHVECMIGCMLESKISVAAAAHLAAAEPVITRADLDGPSLCSEDPYTGGPLFEGPFIRMTDAPGLGITRVPALER